MTAPACVTPRAPRASPKGVLYSHRSQVLHSMSQAMADSCAFSQHDVVMLASPMFHANGWGFSFTAAMVGAKYVLPGPHLDPESILELIEREGVTVTCAVPDGLAGRAADAGKTHALEARARRPYSLRRHRAAGEPDPQP